MQRKIPEELGELHSKLLEKLTLEDISTLCMPLGINHEEIAGDSISAKLTNFLIYVDQKKKIPALGEVIGRYQPDIQLDGIDFAKIEHELKTSELKLEQRYRELATGEYETLKIDEIGRISLLDMPVLGRVWRVEGAASGQAESNTEGDRKSKRKWRQRDKQANIDPASRTDPTVDELSKAHIPLSLALQKHHLLVLLGEPGSGKTATLQHIAKDFAAGESYLPVLIRLKDKSEQLSRVDVRLDRLLADEVARLVQFSFTLEEAHALVKQKLAEGKLAVLLDGLDEVPERSRESVIQEIARFADSIKESHNRIVVTCRSANYSRGVFERPFVEYELLALSDSKTVREYVAHYFEAFGRERGKGYSTEEVERQTESFLQQLSTRSSLKSSAGNPLLLRMAVWVFVGTGKVANNLAGIYKDYFDDLWKRKDTRTPQSAFLISREKSFQLHQCIAWILQMQGKVTVDDLESAIKTQMPDLQNGFEAIEFVHKSLGLLQADGTFTNDAYRDFFVARCLEDWWRHDPKRTWGFLKPRLHHPAWREPTLLLASLLDTDADKLIQLIWKAGSPYEKNLHRDLLLAGSCLTNGAEVDPKTRRNVIADAALLYFRLHLWLRFDTERYPAFQQRLIQPIENIISSLSDIERDKFASDLVQFVQFQNKQRSYLDWTFDARVFFSWLRWYYYLVVEMGSSRWFYNLLNFLSTVNTEAANDRFKLASEAFSGFRLGTEEVITALLTALRNSETRKAAADALGQIGPGTIEIVDALLKAQWQIRHEHGWSGTAGQILWALGLLGQKHPQVVERLIEVVRPSKFPAKPDEAEDANIETDLLRKL